MADLYVNSAYNNETDGYDVTHFNNYSSAYTYATVNAKNSTIIIENGSGTIANEHKNFPGLNITVKDGAKATYEGNKLDMTYDVVIKAGGSLVTTRKTTQSTTYTHIKNQGSLTIGEAGASEKAVFNFGSYRSGTTDYRSNDVAVLSSGSLTANNAIVKVGDFGFSGKASFTDTEITVEGIVAFGKGNSQTMTNSQMTVLGHSQRNEDKYFSTHSSIFNNLTMNKSSITVDDGKDDTVADKVIFGSLTMNDSSFTVEKGTKAALINNVVINNSTVDVGDIELFKSSATLTVSLTKATYSVSLLDSENNEVCRANYSLSGTILSHTFNELAGEYTAIVYNNSGEEVYRKTLTSARSTTTANLTLNNSDFTAKNFDIYNANVTLVGDSTLTVDKFNLTSAGGTITIDYQSTLAFGAVDWGKDAKSITINTENYESGTYQILDYTGPAADPMLIEHYKFMLGENWNDNFKVINGDLYLTDVDTSLVYVDASWAQKADGTEYAVGEEISSGKYYGINAFSSIDAAYDAVAENTTIRLYGEVKSNKAIWDKKLQIIVSDGAILRVDYANDVQFMNKGTGVTVEAGGKIVSIGGGSNYYFKENLTMQGTADKKVTFYGYAEGTKSWGDILTRAAGILIDYADINAGYWFSNYTCTVKNSEVFAGLTLNWENVTVENSNIEVRGEKYSNSLAGATFKNTKLTNSTLICGTGSSDPKAITKTADTITSLTLDNSKAYFVGTQADTITSLTVTGANALAEFDAGVTISSTLTVQNGAQVNFKAAAANAGTIKVDATSKLTATSITGTGTIIIDVTNYEGGIVKVIDQTAGTSLEGKVTVNNANGTVNVIYGADGDVVLSKLAVPTIYVNSAWARTEVGTDLGDGKFYGINAFDSFNFTAGDNTTKLSIAAGTYSNAEGIYNNSVSVIKGGIKEVIADNVVIDKGNLVFATEYAGEVTIQGNFTATDKIRYTGTYNVDWKELQNGHIRFVGGDETIFNIDGNFISGENIQFIGGKTIISAASTLSNNPANWGQYLIDGAEVINYGKMSLNLNHVNGSAMNIIGGGSLTLSGKDASLSINMKDGGASNKDINITNGKLVIKDGASLNVTGAITVAAAGSLNVAGKSTLNIASLSGKIDADDADLTMDITGTAGSQVNIFGESSVKGSISGAKLVLGSVEKSVNATVDVTGWTKVDFAAMNGTVTITGKMVEGSFGLAPMLISGLYNNNNTDIRGDVNVGATTVTVASGAYVTAHQVYVSETGAVNKHVLNVEGELKASASIYNKYNGELNISGTVSANYLQVAGNVTVTGAGAQLNLTGTGGNGAMKIGLAGGGSKLTISNGAKVDADGEISVGYSNRTGDLIVTSATLDAAKISVADGTSFTVSGESTVVIGNLVGELLVNADASLSGGISNEAPYHKDIAVLRVAGSNADGSVAKLTIAQNAVMNNQGLYVRVGNVQDEVITAGAMDIQGAFYAYDFLVEKGSVLDVSGILTGNPANTKQMNIYNDAYVEGIGIKGTANINNGGKVVGAFTTIDAGGVLNINNGGTLYTFGAAGENYNVNTIRGVVNVAGSYITNRGVNVDAGAEFNVTGGTFDYEMLAVNASGKDTVYGQSVFTNNGSVTVAGGSFEAFTLQNNGTISVSGESTLNIKTLSGNSIKLYDGAIIKDSTVGGTLYVAGNVTFRGKNVVKQLTDYGTYYADEYGANATWTIEKGASLELSAIYGLGYGDNGTVIGSLTNAKTAFGTGLTKDDASLIINNSFITQNNSAGRGTTNSLTVTDAYVRISMEGADHSFKNHASDTYGQYQFTFTNSVFEVNSFKFTSSAAGTDGKYDFTITNSVFKTGGEFIFTDVESTMTVNNSDIISTGANGIHENAGTIILTNGATFSNVNSAFTNSGVLSFDNTTTITVGSMQNTGTINFTAGSTYKGGLLIDDLDGTGSNYGTVNITVEGQSGFEAVVVKGDLYAVNAIYVNSAWATDTAVGTKVGDGLYYGVNAFATLEAITPAFTAGPRTVYFTYAAQDIAGLVITVNGQSTITNYTLGGTAYSVLGNQERAHEVTLKDGVYSGTFNFTSGDFSFDPIKTIVKNPTTPEGVTAGQGVASTTGELVQVGGGSGDKSYAFTLSAISDFSYIISGIEGTGRLTLTNKTTGEITTRLFGNNGTYTLNDLSAGNYEATFSGYGYISDEAEFNAKFEFVASNMDLLDDERAYANTVNFTGVEVITNEIGKKGTAVVAEDIMDWFKITNMDPAADGTLVMDFNVEGVGRGSQILVNVYKFAAGDTTLQTIGGFVVNDTLNTEGVSEYDLTKTFYGVSATDTIYVQVFGYGQSDYTINLAPSL